MTETQDKAKAYLVGIRTIERNIRAKQMELDALRYKAMGGGGIRYDKERVQTTPSNYMEMAIIDISDKCSEIEEDKASIENLKGDAYSIIRRMKEPEQRAVLEWFYLNGFSMYETAKKMSMSERNAYYIHDEALEAFGSLL